MYWILFVMGAIAAVTIALIAGGLASPKSHTVTVSKVVAAPIDVVWAIVRDVDAYPAWRPDVQFAKSSTGESGAEWMETSNGRAVRFGITADDAPVRFAARVLDDDVPYTSAWEWRLEAQGTATLVTITERGDVSSPVKRFVGAQMSGYTRALETYLDALARHAASDRRG